MALSRKSFDDIPEDAVIITQEQALSYQWKIITNWENSSEVWSLRHGPGILGCLSALSGAYINNNYRQKLKLGNFGRFSTYLPIVVIPAVASIVGHKMFVQRHAILDPLGECPICLTMRGVAIQAGLGILYPTILAPFAAFMFATRHYTYRLPPIQEQPMEIFRLWRKMTRPLVPALGGMLIGHALVTMYIAFKEMEQNIKVQVKMQEIERKVEEERQSMTTVRTDAAGAY